MICLLIASVFAHCFSITFIGIINFESLFVQIFAPIILIGF